MMYLNDFNVRLFKCLNIPPPNKKKPVLGLQEAFLAVILKILANFISSISTLVFKKKENHEGDYLPSIPCLVFLRRN